MNTVDSSNRNEILEETGRNVTLLAFLVAFNRPEKPFGFRPLFMQADSYGGYTTGRAIE